ncbi:hypothetical protein [Streptomyces sp. NPDC050263]|uniref:hypothetical protein n=1 Tax=Streptomyces sp. NPDC050263 TaxID=3155037 RepID=UPI003441E384
MADKQDRWLDRETAERLLRGESPDIAVAREEAERLARTLGALSALAAEPLPADEELPGEAAALAAFRKAHADRTDLADHTAHTARPDRTADVSGAAAFPGSADVVDVSGVAGLPGTAALDGVVGDAAGVGRDVDAGLVEIGGRGREGGRRSRWGRPARLGLAAALAVGMAGGVAVVAGSGLLPIPFDDDEPSRPAASVSAPVVPDRPLVSPAPELSGGAKHSATPDGGETGETGETGRSDGDTADDDGPAVAAPDARGGWPPDATSSCRDLNAGKSLDSDRRKSLDYLAGGAKRVPAYCAGVLGNSPAGNARGDARTGNGGSGRDTGKGQTDSGGQNGLTPGSNLGDKSGPGSGGDDADDDDDGGHDGRDGRGQHGRNGGGHGGRGHR